MADALRVLYEDNHLIAVFKPAGLLTQGDRSGAPCLIDQVKAYIAREKGKSGRVYLGLLHRLDRPVSGVVLFARTSKAASRLSAQFRAREVRKVYRALCEGVVEPGPGVLEHHIERDPRGVGRVIAHDRPGRGRQLARLRYRRLFERAGESGLEIELETGRKHQIRAQLSRIGHPIVGDRRYGARTPFSASGIALLSWRLGVTHPTGGQRVELVVPDEWSPITSR